MSRSVKRRAANLAQRRRMADELPPIAEGPATGDDALELFTGWSGVQIVLQATFEVFDALPLPLRRTLHQAVVTWDPAPIGEWVQRMLLSHPRTVVVRAGFLAIRNEEAADITKFALQWRQRYRTRLPHLAAHATILRYDSRRRVDETRRRA